MANSRWKYSEPFYHTEAWRRVREQVLLRDNGMCADCMERFRLGYGMKPRRAVLVHHIKPYKERPDLALDMDNLVALCDQCHERRHPERREKPKDDDAPKMRVVKV